MLRQSLTYSGKCVRSRGFDSGCAWPAHDLGLDDLGRQAQTHQDKITQ